MMSTTVIRPTTVERRRRPQLPQLDLFRILVFACVIAVHVTDKANDPGSVPANAALILLHFTRNAFFALTGFVLVYQFADGPLRAGGFWRRRLGLVGIPYVVWSVVYWAYTIHTGQNTGSASRLLGRLGLDLVSGTAYYHLYFLLVTMQAYLLFPLLRKLLRATEGRHRWVLAASAALHLPLLWYLAHPPFTVGVPGQIWTHLYATVFPYQFFTVLGAVTAWHIDAVNAFLRGHARAIVAVTLLAAVAAEWNYLIAIHGGQPPWGASDVFLPQLTIWFVAIAACLYLITTRWAAHRREQGMAARLVRYGADRSFGVFLLHPLVLDILLQTVPASGQPGRTIVLYLLVVALTPVGAEVLRRIPASRWLTGRPMLRTDPFILVPNRFRSPAPSDGASKEVVCSPTP
ncbi:MULTISPECIES: acyltransferase [unclassified Nocardia]|uniref:acyltransferase n=1 Tax=unclassified Nocardia TaxID=2637762 RepID=UPI001CE44889|nr:MULTISPECIES: acyltransferase [unclassified Nocardia]